MRKIVFCILMSVVSLLFVYCIYYIHYNTNSKFDYAIKINNDYISHEEYSAYLAYVNYNDAEISDASDAAVKTAVSVYAAVRFARLNDITPDDQDIKAAHTIYTQLKNTSNISPEILKKVSNNIVIYNKVYNYITDNFILSDKDFDTLFTEYYEKNKKELNTVSVSYIYLSSHTNTLAFAEEIYGKALDGYNFSKLADKYSDSSNTFIKDVNRSSFDESLIAKIYNLAENEFLMEETDKGYYIIKAEKIESPDINTLKSHIRQDFTLQRKDEIYSHQNDKWLENDTIEKDENL